MAASLISSLVGQVRTHLVEASAGFWSDAELVLHMNNAVKDLWRKIAGEYQDYFVTQDTTNFNIAANTSVIAGIPADVYRPIMLRPRVVGQNSVNRGLIFKFRRLNHPEFVQAQAACARKPCDTVVFYTVQNPGAPVAAPVMQIAPQLTDAVLLACDYVGILPNLPAPTDPSYAAYTNPIPGESDNALIAWTVAYAKGKESPDPAQRAPDANWLAIYGTEKQNLVAELSTPRSEQDQEVVEGMFEDRWPDWE